MTEGGNVFEEVRLYLPKWLSPERQKDLWLELRRFPQNKTLYSQYNTDPRVFQADGWRGFVAIDFATLERKTVSGIVLSNSCDLNPDNRRVLLPSLTFAPLIGLDRYDRLLAGSGQTEQQRGSIFKALRRQEITSLMYLPAVQGIMAESIALFSDVRSHPLDHFLATEHSRLFRLSDFGFYLFLFKLSIHFNRMLEGVDR